MGRKDAFAKTVKANFLCEAEIKIGGELMVERATEVDLPPQSNLVKIVLRHMWRFLARLAARLIFNIRSLMITESEYYI